MEKFDGTEPVITVIKGADKGKARIVDRKRFIVGRKVGDFLLSDAKISSAHFALEHGKIGYMLIDLDSTNGTLVGGKRVRMIMLKDGDEITVGNTVLKFTQHVEEGADLSRLRKRQAREVSLREKDLSEEAHVTGVRVKSEITEKLSELDLEDEEMGEKSGRKYLLKVIDGPDEGTAFNLERDKVVLGRISADINLTGSKISRKHAMIEFYGPEVQIRDLSSRHGTFINNRRVISCKLRAGDRIQIGDTTLELVLEN